jgi:cytochrome c oxidase subunit 1
MDDYSASINYENYLNVPGKHKGIFNWIFTTDHKRIGILYLVSIITFFLVGVALGLLMRLELIAPGRTIM